MKIQSKRVWIANQFIPAIIVVEEGKIKAILEYASEEVDIDYGSKRIVPGFIDVHCHGAFGFDTNDAEPVGLRKWTKGIPYEGVTSFLATTVTQSEEVLTKAVENVAKVVEEGYEGAEILGIHFEGPYLDQKYKGAQPEQCILDANLEQFKRYMKASNNSIKLITIATEHDQDFALTHWANENGVAISIGHSASTYEEAALAVGNGAKSMTHVYNGMTAYHHRNPGLVGAAMRFRDMFGEIITDGIHSHLAAVNNYYMAKGRDYAIMITDSLCAKGCPRGTFKLGGNDVTIYEDGSAHRQDGGLAGSTLNINKGLKIVVEDAMVPFDYAINSCTLNPARLLRVDDRKGKIMAGYDADLVVLEDNYDVHQTYCRGNASL